MCSSSGKAAMRIFAVHGCAACFETCGLARDVCSKICQSGGLRSSNSAGQSVDQAELHDISEAVRRMRASSFTAGIAMQSIMSPAVTFWMLHASQFLSLESVIACGNSAHALLNPINPLNPLH